MHVGPVSAIMEHAHAPFRGGLIFEKMFGGHRVTEGQMKNLITDKPACIREIAAAIATPSAIFLSFTDIPSLTERKECV